MKHGLLFVIAAVLCIACFPTGFMGVTPVNRAPPYNGEVMILLGDDGQPTGTPIFVGDYRVSMNPGGNFSRTSPDEGQLADIRQEAARRGANTVVIYCAEPGTVGEGRCQIRGYRR
jgi:hypothetical protein